MKLADSAVVRDGVSLGQQRGRPGNTRNDDSWDSEALLPSIPVTGGLLPG